MTHLNGHVTALSTARLGLGLGLRLRRLRCTASIGLKLTQLDKKLAQTHAIIRKHGGTTLRWPQALLSIKPGDSPDFDTIIIFPNEHQNTHSIPIQPQ